TIPCPQQHSHTAISTLSLHDSLPILAPVTTTTAISSTPFSPQGLFANATYFIRARSIWNSSGNNLLLGASGYTPVISTCTFPSLSSSSITVVSTNSITLIISSGTNLSGRYNVQLSTNSNFGGLGVTVFSSTGPLSGGTTTFGGTATFGNLLVGATYFVR